MTAAMVTKLKGIETGANKYVLPSATDESLGGVIVGANISNVGGEISLTKANVTSADAGEYYVTVTNTLNGNTKEASSFRVKVEISSQDIGSGNGQFDFTSK